MAPQENQDLSHQCKTLEKRLRQAELSSQDYGQDRELLTSQLQDAQQQVSALLTVKSDLQVQLYVLSCID